MTDLSRFYFTYGTSGYPFVGGWTVVTAPDRHAACAAFRCFHPDKIPGIVNCADIYSEDEFLITKMAETGNRGSRCHESITFKGGALKRKVYEK